MVGGFSSPLEFFMFRDQQEFENQMRQQESARQDMQLQNQAAQLAIQQANAARLQEQYNNQKSLAGALRGLLPTETPGLSPQQAQAMLPEIQAFGTAGIRDAMDYAAQPNPMANLLPFLPPEALSAVVEKTLIPDKPFAAPAGSAVFNLPGSAPGSPYIVPEKATAPVFKDEPISATKAQRHMSLDNGRTWVKFGVPFEMHPAGTSITLSQPMEMVDTATGKPIVQRFPNRPGAAPETIPGVAPKPTEGERVASGYYQRMLNAEQLVQNIGEAGYPTELQDTAGSLPLAGSYARRRTSSVPQQQMRQAQEDWVRAKLRKESGAVIAKYEMDSEIETYFPKPGDTPEVIQQKATARKIANEAMGRASGSAAYGIGVDPAIANATATGGKKFTYKGVEYEVVKEMGGGKKLLRNPKTGKMFLYSK